MKVHSTDPERLARFYEEALGCRTVLPLTALPEEASVGVGEPDSEVRILVLELPGDPGGPTLELITAGSGTGRQGMLTFLVDDVEGSAEAVVAAGGSYQGEVAEFVGPSGRRSKFVFMKDPEGNVVDLFAPVG